MEWQKLALVIAAVAFGAFLVWKMRPAFSSSRPKARGALREAKARIEKAKTPGEKSLALCDAGDACAYSLGRTTGAIGYYLRAMRSDPISAELVERAARGLARRPHALESLLWRRLGAEPWGGEGKHAAIAALRHLSRLYAGALRNRSRARAIDHALAALGATPPPTA